MKLFSTIIKSDYLQRTRSYTFLITLCASLAIAYTFVPEPNASYRTLSVSDYVGFYNSAWFGYVTAVMTSVFLSLIGFYLVNGTIKTDAKTKVGQIIASSPISNFMYLLTKTVSNFLVLLTIVGMVFLMSIILFFLYNDGFPFEIIQFIKPYALITIPAMFSIAALAVIFEVIFGKYTIVQNILFFFLFTFLSSTIFTTNSQQKFSLDAFGSKIVVHEIEETVQGILQTDENTSLNIGYTYGNTSKTNKFHFNGMDFPVIFIMSRFLWVILSIILIIGISLFFNRFDSKTAVRFKQQAPNIIQEKPAKEIMISNDIEIKKDYGILPLLKTELLLLVRKGKKWLWIINGIGMVLLAVLPLAIAHQFILPILWFLQVHRISELTTKERYHNTHFFTFTSYRPLYRLLLSQLSAGVLLLLFLALPILVRHTFNFQSISAIVLGAVFITALSAIAGILTKGKKFFEIVFFMVTYANINKITFLDYFGAMRHTPIYIIQLSMVALVLIVLTFIFRNHQLKQ